MFVILLEFADGGVFVFHFIRFCSDGGVFICFYISDPASARMTMNVLTVSVIGEDISDPASARMTMNVLTVSVSGEDISDPASGLKSTNPKE